MADNPYSSLPDHRFWRKAVAALPPFALDPIVCRRPSRFRPRRQGGDRRKLLRAGNRPSPADKAAITIILPKQPPRRHVRGRRRERRNYSMYSCRYGNFTPRRNFAADPARLWRFHAGCSTSGTAPTTAASSIRSGRASSRTAMRTLEEMRADREQPSRRRARHDGDDGCLRLHLRPYRDAGATSRTARSCSSRPASPAASRTRERL